MIRTNSIWECERKREKYKLFFFPATFRPSEWDHSAFPESAWAPGRRQSYTLVIWVYVHGREEISPLEDEVRYLPLEECQRRSLSCWCWWSVPHRYDPWEKAEFEGATWCRVLLKLMCVWWSRLGVSRHKVFWRWDVRRSMHDFKENSQLQFVSSCLMRLWQLSLDQLYINYTV